MAKYMVFDVKSVGLHGPVYAVGWVVVDETLLELDNGVVWCYPPKPNPKTEQEDCSWAEANVLPSLNLRDTVRNTIYLMEWFCGRWKALQDEHKEIYLCADVPWPVETNFLSCCVRLAHQKPSPYPLIDVASVRLSAGLDPVATCERRRSELPKYNPLADARQSARLLIEALSARKSLLEG